MNTTAITLSSARAKIIFVDITALLFIYFTPAISHLLNFPLYLLEPMRIMLILSLAHTNRRNAYLIALTLPLFSLIISSHPSVLKSLLITAELFLNVYLFIYFSEKIRHIFGAALLSIIISKSVYYIFKYIFITSGMLQSELISTPLLLQGVVAIILSGYLTWIKIRITGQGLKD